MKIKRGKTLEIAFCLFLCFLMLSCGKVKSTEETASEEINENVVFSHDLTTEAYNYADSLLANMSLEEKAGQCLFPSIFASDDAYTLNALKKFIEEYHIGGIVLMEGNVSAAETIGETGSEAPIPLIIAIDAEWGLGMRLKDAPIYPKNGNFGPETEDTLMFDYGRRIAEESREAGINMILGPVLDITSQKSGVIGKRSFGTNPYRVSELGVAYAKGLESGGVISVAKHFPGHGSTVMDSHSNVAIVERDISSLDSIDLKPFRDYISSGLTAIMAGHIRSKALDPEGNAATVSMDMLTFLLREEMGFKGLILTDAFDMGGANGFSAGDAILAGADIVLSPRNVEMEYDILVSQLKNGDIDMGTINDRVRRILFYKKLFAIVKES